VPQGPSWHPAPLAAESVALYESTHGAHKNVIIYLDHNTMFQARPMEGGSATSPTAIMLVNSYLGTGRYSCGKT